MSLELRLFTRQKFGGIAQNIDHLQLNGDRNGLCFCFDASFGIPNAFNAGDREQACK
jgi:hypothetical protein